MELKYLSDGRKVAVVGKLNNVETIVQEVFVTKDGDEVPGGERFVTKSLHDEPVISWAARETQRAEAALANIKDQISRYSRESSEAYERLLGMREMVRSVTAFTKLVSDDNLEVFVGFMTGTIEYLVEDSYRFTPPVKLKDALYNEDRWHGESKFDGLKLLSVMGKSEGKLSYRLNRYGDGSGNYSEVHPFNTLNEALSHIKKRAEEKIASGHFDAKDYAACLGMGISFSEEIKATFKARLQKGLEQSEAAAQKDFSQREASLQSMRDMIASI